MFRATLAGNALNKSVIIFLDDHIEETGIGKTAYVASKRDIGNACRILVRNFKERDKFVNRIQ
jgi:ribosomal protein L10